MIESSQFHHDFWTHYAGCYPQDGVRSGPSSHYVHHPSGNSDLIVAQFLAWYTGRAGMYICKSPKSNSSKSVFELVEPYKSALIKALNVNLDQPPTYFKIKHGKFYAHMDTPIDRHDRATWAEAADWLHEHLTIYRHVLS